MKGLVKEILWEETGWGDYDCVLWSKFKIEMHVDCGDLLDGRRWLVVSVAGWLTCLFLVVELRLAYTV